MKELSATSKLLIKLFAKAFFKANSGFLVFLFGALISYCFFMNTVGDVNLITSKQLTFYHFIFVITFISNPLMTILICFFWMIYSAKSWLYICKLIVSRRYQFLLYSVTSLKKSQQILNWSLVQLIINIPLIIYWVFSLIFGVLLRHYLLPGLTIIFIAVLTGVGALIYYYKLSRLQEGNSQGWTMGVLKRVRKPYFPMFEYHIVDQLKMPFAIVKLFSLLLISFIVAYYDDIAGNVKIAAFFALTIASSHTYLFYRHHRFEEEYLAFIRNIPLSRAARYRSLAFACSTLIVPEGLWLFIQFRIDIALLAWVFAIGAALLFRCILYYSSYGVRRYFKLVFSLYFILFLFLLYDHTALLATACLLLSFTVFYKRFYVHLK